MRELPDGSPFLFGDSDVADLLSDTVAGTVGTSGAMQGVIENV